MVPQLEQEDKVGKAFFVAQNAAGVFIEDGDDGESPETESGLGQREAATPRVTGWCNGDAVRIDGPTATVAADTLSRMPHGRWRSCIAMGMSSGILHTRAPPEKNRCVSTPHDDMHRRRRESHGWRGLLRSGRVVGSREGGDSSAATGLVRLRVQTWVALATANGQGCE